MYKNLFYFALIISIVLTGCGQIVPDTSEQIHVEYDPTNSDQLFVVLNNAGNNEEIILGKGDFVINQCKGYRLQTPIQLRGKGIGKTTITCKDDDGFAFLIFNSLITHDITYKSQIRIMRGTVSHCEFLSGISIFGGAEIHHSKIQNGLVIGSASYVNIYKNHIFNSDRGIDVEYSDNINIHDNHIYDNKIGVNIIIPEEITISDNLIEKNGWGISVGFWETINGIKILDNHLLDNTSYAMTLVLIGYDIEGVVSIVIQDNKCLGEKNEIYLLGVSADNIGVNIGCKVHQSHKM
jgi:parallel beta-helix repeat protein